jgi:hypothetical protein
MFGRKARFENAQVHEYYDSIWIADGGINTWVTSIEGVDPKT